MDSSLLASIVQQENNALIKRRRLVQLDLDVLALIV